MDLPNKQAFHVVCNFHFTEVTPEQLKQNPITVHPIQKLDTDEGESTLIQFAARLNLKQTSFSGESMTQCIYDPV